MGSAIRHTPTLALLAGFGLALASLDTPPREAVVPLPTIVPPAREFFLGAWCSPPTSTTDPEVWREFARTGLEMAVRPLEDPNDRARNLATLRLLDSLDGPKVSLLARDDAVHPDEATRPGWRERVDEVVAAYRGHRALAGYFLADEPKPADIDRVAEVAAAFAEADPEHPTYINLLPTFENSTIASQARWRADAIRLIRQGKLQMWSFSAYSQRRWGEDATFLLSLQNAALVAQATGVPFDAILQFTGFGPLDPLPPAQLDYLAAEAIAHGARGIIWFTYWTPNPHEPVQEWKGGAVEYDGTRSARADLMRTANLRARALESQFPNQPRTIAHLGGALPRGTALAIGRIRGLMRAEGGPMTIAATLDPRVSRWLVINRDRAQARTFTLYLDPGFSVNESAPQRTARIDLPAGGSAVLTVLEHE